MSSENLFNEEELSSSKNDVSSEAKVKKAKLVRTKKAPTVKVKIKKEEIKEDPSVIKEALEVVDAVVTEAIAEEEKVQKPKARGRKPSKKEVKEETTDSNTSEDTKAETQIAEEVKTETTSSEEVKVETTETTEETQNTENTETTDDSSNQNKNNRFQNNRNNRNNNNRNNKKGNNNQKVKKEELPAEINLDENPDCPKLWVSDLAVLSLQSLRNVAKERGITEEVIFDLKREDLTREILRLHAAEGGALLSEGTLDIHQESFGYLRYAINSYLSGSEDVYLSQGQIRSNGLRKGDTLKVQLRCPREGEKSAYAVVKILSVNGLTPQEAKLRTPFEYLTPLFPDERLHLESLDTLVISDISNRVVDIFSPIGKGQRSLLVAPPRTGKTVLMQKIANAIVENHPEVHLMVLLVDERPEEVTDMRRNVKAEVVASTFDEMATKHVAVAEMVIEKAKRLVEMKRDVVILLDSITRLARAYNQTVPASGKILSGGVDSNALHKPKRFFGAARNIEEGGSLTIISTALIETGSRMDEVIFEEFKGTGNNEVVLDRRMADSRKFPAINIKKSGTRRDDLLLTKEELAKVLILRNHVNNLEDYDMSVFLIDKMKKTNNNKEFFASMGSTDTSGF